MKPFSDPQPAFPLGAENAIRGRIPVRMALDKADACFARKDIAAAGRVLEYWRGEALRLGDRSGQLSIENELIGFYRKTEDREKCLEAVNTALTLLKALGQEDTVSCGTILLNCATAYKAFGRADKALPLYRRAEALYRGRVPEDDPLYGGLYNNMALALVDLGEYQKAESAYLSALAVMNRVPGGEADAAITYVNMAHLYEVMDEPDWAQAHLDQAYALLTESELPHNGYFAYVCEKCAPSFAHFGQTRRAEILEREAEDSYAGT